MVLYNNWSALNTNQNCVLYMCNLNSLNCSRSHVHTCLVPITISTPFPSSQPHNNCSSTMHCITESSPIKPCWLQVSGSNLKPTCIGSIHCCNPYSYQIKLLHGIISWGCIYIQHMQFLFALAGFELALVLFLALPKDWMAMEICGSVCVPLLCLALGFPKITF